MPKLIEEMQENIIHSGTPRCSPGPATLYPPLKQPIMLSGLASLMLQCGIGILHQNAIKVSLEKKSLIIQKTGIFVLNQCKPDNLPISP